MNTWERQAAEAGVLEAPTDHMPRTAPGRARALARDAEHHRRASEDAAARGDAAEADLWTALADEIDRYLDTAASASDAPALFDPD